VVALSLHYGTPSPEIQAFRRGTVSAEPPSMRPEDLRLRTKRFALDVIAFWRRLPTSRDYQEVGDDLLRAGTAVASNYRAARCGRSHAEFTAKIGTVREEADECQHCLEMLTEMGLEDTALQGLHQEATELLAIFTTAHKTATRRSRRNGSNRATSQLSTS
jgi:four helix bundle protein